ncbi:MAG: TadG family pilus assembly protein [Rhodanobacter sp.]
MSVAMLLLLLGLLGMLGLIEVGYLYWARRDAQKVADLAALAGAQRLDHCADDNSGNSAAQGNAQVDNGFPGSLAIACGHWNPALAGDQHFVGVSADLPRNAVRVQAARPLVPFFGFAHFSSVGATAIAVDRGHPVAAFSVGSSLLDVNAGSPLNALLNSALGTSLGLQLLSYNGIANARISLLGLKGLLGIDAGTVSGVLDTQVSTGEFLDAFVQALGQSPDAANIDLDFVRQQVAAIDAQLGDVPLRLGDILDVHATTDDPEAALNAEVNALDVLTSALLAADGKNAVALPAATIDVPGVAKVGLMVSIIEPPQIGVGGVGTTAHTAQVRLKLDVSAVNSALTGNESLMDVPLYLEVAPTDATITAIECGATDGSGRSVDNITIATAPGVLNAFLGRLLPPGAFGNNSQTWASLMAGSGTVPLVNVKLLGLPIATLNASSSVQLTTIPAGSHTFSVDPAMPVAQQPGMTWPPPSSTQPPQLGNVIASLLTSTNLKTDVTLLGLPTGLDLGALLSGLSALLRPVLVPLFNTLDTALTDPLLQALGIEIGTAQVNLRSVDCNHGAQLVY